MWVPAATGPFAPWVMKPKVDGWVEEHSSCPASSSNSSIRHLQLLHPDAVINKGSKVRGRAESRAGRAHRDEPNPPTALGLRRVLWCSCS